MNNTPSVTRVFVAFKRPGKAAGEPPWMAKVISSLESLRVAPRSLKKTASAILLAAFASTLAIRNAARFVRNIDTKALHKKRARTAKATNGRVWAFSAGKLKPAKETIRPGSLPEVRKKVTDVATKPIAKTAAKSTRAKAALRPVNTNQRNLSC